MEFAQGGHALSSGRVTEASVRLAAQRLVPISGRPIEEEEITFHDNMPGRLVYIMQGDRARDLPLES